MTYTKEKIRNVAVVGSAGSGKTSLVEAILFNAKIINRLGRVEDGNTVSDFNSDEIGRVSSIYTSLISFDKDGTKINLIDTPGYSDFIGDAISAVATVDSAIFVFDALSEIDATLEYLWDNCDKPKAIFINKLDKEDIDLSKILSHLKDFNGAVIPVFLPNDTGAKFSKVHSVITDVSDETKDYREKFVEAVASSDDSLIEKYLDGKEITAAELTAGFKNGIASLFSKSENAALCFGVSITTSCAPIPSI